MSCRLVAASLALSFTTCVSAAPALGQTNLAQSSTVELPMKFAAERGVGTATSVSLMQLSIPGNARSLYKKAAKSMDRGNLNDAFEKVNAALAIWPKFPDALVLRGALERDAGKPVEATADFQQAIQYDANYAIAYLGLASMFNSGGRFAESLPLLTHAQRLAPTVWQTYFELARADVGTRKFDEALYNLQYASTLLGGEKKEWPEIHLLRGNALLGLNQTPRAAHEFESYLASKPSGVSADAARSTLNLLHAPTITATQ